MSPAESIPNRRPSSCTMGTTLTSPSRMVRQARSSGTERLSAGVRS